ncbi:MAG: hypothetical protein ACLP22_14715 [Solirubrobacteraceae bacterium]
MTSSTRSRTHDLERELGHLAEIDSHEPPREFRDHALLPDPSSYEQARSDPLAFGGFAVGSVRERMEISRAKALVTVDGARRKRKTRRSSNRSTPSSRTSRHCRQSSSGHR